MSRLRHTHHTTHRHTRPATAVVASLTAGALFVAVMLAAATAPALTATALLAAAAATLCWMRIRSTRSTCVPNDQRAGVDR
jgi:Flp pilus assembly protein TadB